MGCRMSDLEKILWTTAGTIIGGVVVLVMGQVVTRLFIEPIYELKRTVGNIAHALIFHAPNYGKQEVRDFLRQKASDLLARACGVPFYPVVWFVSVGMIPSKRSILKANRALIGLANNPEDAPTCRRKVCKALGLNLGFSDIEVKDGT